MCTNAHGYYPRLWLNTSLLCHQSGGEAMPRSRERRSVERSDVMVSAVISTYLLTHLHHVLQRAEFGAEQEGRTALAANYAQLRKALCLDARSLQDNAVSPETTGDSPKAA
jgi:hypothetical protein